MTILAASVVTKSGKVLVSRQFLAMPRSRIEGLMAAFPKLVASGTQHTTVDADDVRFVYQPLDTHTYLVLTTAKLSNILHDTQSLHLFARVVAEHCKTLDERDILDHAFDLILAFDELVALGYRENVTLPQLRQIALMDSHEERLQDMIAKNKELEAKEQSRLKAKQLELQRKAAARAGSMGGPGSGSSMPGYGPGSAMHNAQPAPYAPSTYVPPSASSPGPAVTAAPVAPSSRPFDSSAKSGMKLGGAKKAPDFAEAFGSLASSSAPVTPIDTSVGVSPTPRLAVASPAAAAQPQPKEPVHVTLDERVTCIVNRDGGLQQLEVKGDLYVHVTSPDAAHAHVQVTLPSDLPGAQFKTHPNMDKKLWSASSTLALKDASKTFPVGQPTGVLKWRFVSSDEAQVPLAINCWPNPSADGTCDVNIEYELLVPHLRLTNVTVAIPVPAAPTVAHVDGDTLFDRARSILYWTVSTIDAGNASGSLDFKAAGDQPGAFFPVAVNFASDALYCNVVIAKVAAAAGADAPEVEFGVTASCQPDEYKVV
ncbi:hypothetical protein AMAG_13444 [Allomyces macrogynus ATCC 38327]|uniref:Coatomer subunit delta n=1 Tax=Allomyces macrogynus (strain ATCC 38327) TaxID=578462 RepID=A0A0L0T2J1_ALLM3|nr:hypothetical protein AMAG_13444 [Allomyces macrogynus ATCC 38327]|eukprot:KNE68804.1 hypothetical protein AMAG_13444 [Allomyces macrogynus ATCC 38327]